VEKGLRAIRRRAAHRRTEQALREAEARYVQAQRMEVVGRLAEGVAHDFNNILQVILGSLEVLQMDLAPANPIREELRPIEEAARRASELVRQLLAFGRKEPADPRPLDLNALAEALQRLLRRVVRKDIVLELRLDPRTPSVRGDYLQIEQALMNLCVNAQDALEGRGGTIRIETGRIEGAERDERAREDSRFAESDAWAVLTVRDDGPGIPEAIRERIFEPFFTTKEGGRGTGLGLATVYWVARQHGGFAALDPQEGGGTAFSLYLPCRADRPGPAPGPYSYRRASMGRSREAFQAG
jgi:signal transduction histidine kinase